MKPVFTTITIFFILLTLLLLFWLKPKDRLINSSVNNKVPIAAPIPTDKSSNTLPTVTAQDNQTILPAIPQQQFKAQTTWSDKTLNIHGNTLHYQFGTGNPDEVALTPEQYLPIGEQDGIPYVTADAEYKLQAFLADKYLPELLDKCVHFLNIKMLKDNPTVPVQQLMPILENTDVDIENYLIIDRVTGRKMINPAIDNRMNAFLNTLNNPLGTAPLALECFGLNRMADFDVIQGKYHALGKAYIHAADNK